jgi:hypothetical protein
MEFDPRDPFPLAPAGAIRRDEADPRNVLP